MVDDHGQVLGAEYLVEADGGQLALILESSSGSFSPYADDRSAITDCRKLAESGFAGRRAILIYGFEDSQRPLVWLIDVFETIAALAVRLGPREQAPLGSLMHPVFATGYVYAWEILPAELTATNAHTAPTELTTTPADRGVAALPPTVG